LTQSEECRHIHIVYFLSWKEHRKDDMRVSQETPIQTERQTEKCEYLKKVSVSDGGYWENDKENVLFSVVYVTEFGGGWGVSARCWMDGVESLLWSCRYTVYASGEQ